MKFASTLIAALCVASSALAFPESAHSSDISILRERWDAAARSLKPAAETPVLSRRGVYNGGKCKNDGDCTSQWCKGSFAFFSGTCTEKLQPGEVCSEAKECQSNQCQDPGFFQRKKCGKPASPKGSVNQGGACYKDEECKSEICRCANTPFLITSCYGSVCMLRSEPQFCLGDNQCDTGICAGSPGVTDRNKFRCQPSNLANGKYCLDSRSCASGLCKNQCVDKPAAAPPASTAPIALPSTAPTGTTIIGHSSAAASATGTTIIGHSSAAASATGTGHAHPTHGSATGTGHAHPTHGSATGTGHAHPTHGSHNQKPAPKPKLSKEQKQKIHTYKSRIAQLQAQIAELFRKIERVRQQK